MTPCQITTLERETRIVFEALFVKKNLRLITYIIGGIRHEGD